MKELKVFILINYGNVQFKVKSIVKKDLDDISFYVYDTNLFSLREVWDVIIYVLHDKKSEFEKYIGEISDKAIDEMKLTLDKNLNLALYKEKIFKLGSYKNLKSQISYTPNGLIFIYEVSDEI